MLALTTVDTAISRVERLEAGAGCNLKS